MAPNQWIRIAKCPANHSLDLLVLAGSGVAESHQRVPSKIPRVTFGDVPAPEPIKQFVIAGVKHCRGIDICKIIDCALGRPFWPPNWTHLLTVVTPIEPSTKGLTKLSRNSPRSLDQPGQAATGIDYSALKDGTCRTTIEALPACAATIFKRS
tara:strand:- start:584 stop:1042 length:459 start_codon:yes stop_codon:yes gene_type:complete